jgi:amino acid efflux transporter
MTHGLQRSLGLGASVAYCVTIMVGAGALALPGSAYALAGQNAVLAWIFDFVLAIPLLCMFCRLVTRVQSAGGIADFVKHAFGAASILHDFSQLLLVVTLFIGTAAIAIVGAEHLTASLSFGPFGRVASALLLIGVPTLLHVSGRRIGATVQKIAAAALLLFLLVIIGSSVGSWESSRILAFDASKWEETWQAMGLIWFAYTGVEMVSFLGEEFRSPRTFVLAMVIAFLVVGLVYVGLAIVVSQTLAPADPRLQSSPMISVLDRTFGERAAWVGGILGFVLILINLNGAILSASRLIFSVAREGTFLPRRLSALHRAGIPSRALWLLGMGSMVIVLLISALGWSTRPLFVLVSQNWFILYIVSILAFMKIETGRAARLLGLAAFVFACLFMKVFSWFLVIPGGILGCLLAARWIRRGRNDDRVECKRPIHEDQAVRVRGPGPGV